MSYLTYVPFMSPSDKPLVLNIPYSEDLLLITGQEPEVFEREARFLLALKFFELRRISAGKAAELSGLSKPEFLANKKHENTSRND